MQLLLDPSDQAYRLRGADGAGALVNDRRLLRSFAIAPDTLLEDWPAVDAGSLSIEQLEPLFALRPEVIVLGSGARQVFPPAATLAACLQRGIGLETMTNGAAARTFNVLAGDGRRVVAGFVIVSGVE